MPDQIDYHPEMDLQVVKAAEEILRIKISGSQRLFHGEQNFVYKLKTDKKSYLARIFREKWWPEKDKYLWLESKLSENNIPHAKVIYHHRDSRYFPFGLMILEFVEGVNGEEAIKTGLISFQEFHRKLSRLLRAVHSISLPRFGLIKNGQGEFADYEEYRAAELRERTAKIKKIPHFDLSLLKEVESAFRKTWREIKLLPVLVHGDATPDNVILTKEGEMILIDWDNAKGDIWFEDYAWLIYCGSHVTQEGTLAQRREIIYEASEELKNGQNLDELERVYNVTKAISLLPYYYFNQRNQKHYEYTLNKLKEALKISNLWIN